MFKSFRRVFIAIAVFAVAVALVLFFKVPVLASFGFFGIFLFLIFLNGKNSILRNITMDKPGKSGHAAIIIFAVAVILLCVLPMDLSPFWNGKIPMHRNQYELLADSIMEGHLYIDYDDIDPKLLAMENPYDYEERLKQEVICHWDHAFYDGHYYMYFGVVPVFVLFIPFKAIFGKTLVTFHATQFFMIFAIIAFFALFYMIAKRFFGKMPLGTFLLVSSAVCLTTLGYITQAPALYCTAICGAIFFMLYSLCFYFYAVYYAKKEWTQVLFACLGALSGALAFGCRPPVALANIIAVPLAITYAKNYKGKHIVRNFILIIIPYIIVAGLLMAYNYARFKNPLEFGQAYQLTSGDQTIYLDFTGRLDLFSMVQGVFENLFSVARFENKFPFLYYGGFLVTYPLMWLIVIFYSKDSLHKQLKADKVGLLVLTLVLEPIIVSAFDVYWAPGLCERYRLDAYFIVGLLAFMLIGFRIKTTENKNLTNTVVSVFAAVSMLMAILMFFYPNDGNYAYIFPEKVDEIRSLLTFGLQ